MGSDVNAAYFGETDPAKIIAELCRQFYFEGWMPGTAGAMSILGKGPSGPDTLLYVSPSGVQKERMQPGDMTIFDTFTKRFIVQSTNQFKPSASSAVFQLIYELTGTKACIHTHSKNAVLVTAILPNSASKFTISEVENIKAIPKYTEAGNLSFYDTLSIPIIDNKAHEEELVDDLATALRANPGAPAVLVRRHGLYVWGRDAWKAKVVNEAIEYLIDLKVAMHSLRIDS